MRALKRGFRNFRRHPLRNLVVILLLFVCLTFSLSMLAVKLASDSQVQEVKESVGNYGEIKVSSDYTMQVFEEERSKSESERQTQSRTMTAEEQLAQRTRFLVSEEITDAFSQEAEVITYDKVLDARISVDDLTNSAMESMLSMRERNVQTGGTAPAALSSDSFSFEGNTNGSSLSDFMVGSKKLTEGSFYSYQDYLKANPVVIIEKTLAETNELSVGDTLTATISGQSGKSGEVDLTIIGIYETVQAEEQVAGQETFNPMGDTLYAPLSVVQKLYNTPGYVQLGSYYFDSEDSVAVLQQVFDNELSDGTLEFATDQESFEVISDPLTKVGKTSMIGLAGALGACALIILLAMAIIIGGRTRELGVLKAIGATNRQVMAQYAVEVICICLVAIILAMGVSAMISQKMGNWLLSDDTATAEQSVTQGNGNGMPQMGFGGAMDSRLYKEGSGFSSGSQESLKLNVVYQGSLFLYGILILFFIGLLGMAVPVIWITRLKPARVLSIE
ncbi:MAG: hypothetical protein A2W01_01230 [Candidatus Solincola sediminis]|uniref:ABC transporter permease n=1 Tax=Candidatus Solincola sediminis TaxID=1797199 RepID=A0A1F2WUD8_9ACTN|nr:MAG: hypothetical protein A2W01_01230 [Candidatus Solincola sediminis]OFW60508.1 MAG: hypothetical protein A2Y75_06330 [Candidatus Solincola sediminis]